MAAEECLISRSTSSSGASAPRWRIGRCAKRKPSGDGCENERSQVRYTRLSRVNFSLKPDFVFINYGARFLPRFFFSGTTNEDCNLRIETGKQKKKKNGKCFDRSIVNDGCRVSNPGNGSIFFSFCRQ